MLAIQLSGTAVLRGRRTGPRDEARQPLCHGVGSYCSARLPIIRTCIETTETCCCFNSRLSRIINEQGRAQLGRGWGGARAPTAAASHSTAAPGAGLLAHGPQRVLRGESRPRCRTSATCSSAPAEGQQLLRPMTFIAAILSVPDASPRARRGPPAHCSPCQARHRRRSAFRSRRSPLLALAAESAGARRAHRSRRRLHASPLRCRRADRDRRIDALRPAPVRLRAARSHHAPARRAGARQTRRSGTALAGEFCRDGSFPEKR